MSGDNGERGRLRGVLALAVLLVPLPALAGLAAEAEGARQLPKLAVTVRAGDLYVGDRQVTGGAAEDSEPDWSPDRRRIAFVRQEPGARGTSLLSIRRDGSGLVRLTRREQVVTGPAWSPDGLSIAYAASPLSGGSFDVSVVPARGGAARLVAGGPAEQLVDGWPGAGAVRIRTLVPGEPLPAEKTRDTGTPASGPRELLPDFDQRAPFRLTLVGTKLGFASATDNVGEGPVWIRGSRASARAPMLAQQLVRLSDGSVRTYAHAGTLRYTPSPTHTHWHVLDFQRYELRTLAGALLVRDRKSGFCLADHYGLAARRVAAFRGPRFLGNCAAYQPKVLSVEQGSSPGYTDLYPPNFHGQNLELRGIPAGTYVLVHRANPQELLEELDYSNNAASIRIGLTWAGGVARVETLKTCQASARC